MKKDFRLYVFYTNDALTQECMQAGADGIVVDWEIADKRHRQSLFNTQVNQHDVNTLKSATNLHCGTVICRVNGGKSISRDEIVTALAYGATDILLPMISKPRQVEQALKIIEGKARCLVMIETPQAVKMSKELGELPIDGVYVGLNDLAIARKSRNIFEPMEDGTIDVIRDNIPVPLGVAGLTHPTLGSPIPSHLLVNELRRTGCDFTFLRRSFFKDASQAGVAHTIDAIRSSLATHQVHFPEKTEQFKKLVKEIVSPMI